ncbi:PEP-utilizing enzyme [Nocardia lijiangensis]|uniref:PEP-utilizing enzyme n=1 Tax=Nocardia lijiangensis TaxID=299618 RepID=UPI003D71CB26
MREPKRLGVVGPLDTDPHPVFRTYSAGNFGEVAPERLSPFSWSLVGPPMEAATRRMTTKMWGERAWMSGEFFTFLGYFKCRPYHNYSAYGQIAASVPGIDADDVGQAYFEGVPAPEPYEALVENPLIKAKGVVTIAREVSLAIVRIRNLEECLFELEARACEAGFDVRLLASKALSLLKSCWYEHILSTTALVPLSRYQERVLTRVCDDPEDIVALLTRPDELVWKRLHRLTTTGDLNSADFLNHPFYEVAYRHPLWAKYSHRLQVESDGSELSESFLAPADAIAGMYKGVRYRVIAGVTKTVAETMACREHSKSMVMRVLHVFRTLGPALAAAQSIPDELWPFLTVEELVNAPRGDLREIVEDRVTLCEQALAVVLPENIEILPDGEIIEPIAAAVRVQPRGVSGGSASGIAVRPEEDVPDEEFIIVCEAADADVVPLLRFASGVVSRRGSAMSHLAILCREYGIPCVVGADIDSIPSGAVIAINGGTGKVKNHE